MRQLSKFTQALVLGAAVGLSGAAAMAKDITYATYITPTHPIMKYAYFPYVERIEQQTGGEVKIKVYTGGSLGGPKELLPNVRNGIIDSGTLVSIYTAADLPTISALAGLMASVGDVRAAIAAANEVQLLHCPECLDEAKRNNFLNLALGGGGPYVMMCTKPVSTIEDLQGLKIRATSGVGYVLDEVGATPVSVTAGEIYEAMQRGQVDCAAGPTSWMESFNLKERVRYVTDLPLGVFFGTIIQDMNLDTWNSLTEEQRQIFINNSAKLVSDQAYGYMKDDAEVLQEVLQNGVEMVEPSADLRALVEKLQSAEFQRITDTEQERGTPGASAAIEAYSVAYDKWVGIVAEIGEGNPEAYQKALWDEIFSKL